MIPGDTELARAAWAQAWQVTLLIAVVVLVARLVARNRPHLSHALWLVVLVKCLTPPVFSSVCGVFCWMQTEASDSPAIVVQAAPVAKEEEGGLGSSRLNAMSEARPSTPPEPPLAAGEIVVRRAEIARSCEPVPYEIEPQSPVKGQREWLAGVLIDAWVLGTVAVLSLAGVRLAVCWIQVRRSVCQVDRSGHRLMASLSRRLKLRRPARLVVTKSRVGPAVIGLFRPTVLLPEVVVRGKPPDDLEPILAHELIHARRGDLWVGMLWMLAQSVWWFHPLVWWASRLASREAERCCDEAVVAELGCHPARYARCLFSVLERKRVLNPLPAFPGVRPVEVTSRRLERIMRLGQGSHKRSPMWCWVVMALAAAVTLPGAALVVTAGDEGFFEAQPNLKRLGSGLSIPVDKGQPKPMPLQLVMAYPVADLVSAAQSALNLSERKARLLLRQTMLRQTIESLDPQPLPAMGEQRSVAWHGENLVVRASSQEHGQIVEALKTMRTHGFSQIAVETCFITGPASKIETATRFHWPMLQGDIWKDGSQDPLAGLSDPAAKQAPSESAAGHGRARMFRAKNIPVRCAILDRDEVAALLGQLQTSDDTEAAEEVRQRVRRLLRHDGGPAGRDQVDVMYAPRVSVFNGQQASIRDSSLRPFVVSMKRVVGTDGEGGQPVIQHIDEGLQLGLRPELQGEDSVRLDCELTLTHVVDVDEFTFQGTKGSQGSAYTVQIPDVETTRLDTAAVVPVGKTLLIGVPNRTRDADGKPQSMLVMLSPTKVMRSMPSLTGLLTRVYSVADLVVPIPDTIVVSADEDAAPTKALVNEADFDPLVELITSTLSPETWDKVGGTGSIVPWEANLSLVVHQTVDVHERIAELLKQTRDLQDVLVQMHVELVQMPKDMAEKIGLGAASEKNSTTMAPRETRLLRAFVEEANMAGIHRMPTVTLLKGQQAVVAAPNVLVNSRKDAAKIRLQAVVSDDRRSVRVALVVDPQDAEETSPDGQHIPVIDGQTLVHEVSDQLQIAWAIGNAPPIGNPRHRSDLARPRRHDVKDRQTFLLVTPKVIVPEEEERLILGGVNPRLIIQEEEEELLGIPDL